MFNFKEKNSNEKHTKIFCGFKTRLARFYPILPPLFWPEPKYNLQPLLELRLRGLLPGLLGSLGLLFCILALSLSRCANIKGKVFWPHRPPSHP